MQAAAVLCKLRIRPAVLCKLPQYYTGCRSCYLGDHKCVGDCSLGDYNVRRGFSILDITTAPPIAILEIYRSAGGLPSWGL
jgi:hypothetical protein